VSENGEPNVPDLPIAAADPKPPASAVPVLPVLPTIADGSDRKLHPRAVLVWRITALIWVGATAAVNFIGIGVLLFASSLMLPVKLLLLSGWALIFGVAAGFAAWWPAVRYRHIWYRIDSHGMTICRGVVWRSVASIPRSRIQHTDVSRGPIERNFELATLIVHTAGTENASISLSGLPHDDALAVRDYLIEVGDDDAV
jgi:membrane protein YdbS with pleckstrin-like domain